MTTLSPAPIRTGSVRILRNAMAKTLGECSRQYDAATLAMTGSLLVSITSETRQGPVTASYRVEKVDGGFTLSKCVVGPLGWIRDAGEVWTLDESFDTERVRCDCPDAKRVTRLCKHVLACESLKVIAPQQRD